MKSILHISKSNRKSNGTLLLLFTFLLATACAPKPQVATKHQQREPMPQLHTGDVVLRAGTGPYSRTLANLNARDKTWSHCGIVVVENGYPFVYHSIGGEDNPDMRLRRDSASHFFAARYCKGMGVARYNSSLVDSAKLAATVRQFYARRPLFDMQFDLATDEKLYCSEFIYKAIVQTTGDTLFIPTSQAQGKQYVGIDDLYLNRHAHLVWKVLL